MGKTIAPTVNALIISFQPHNEKGSGKRLKEKTAAKNAQSKSFCLP